MLHTPTRTPGRRPAPGEPLTSCAVQPWRAGPGFGAGFCLRPDSGTDPRCPQVSALEMSFSEAAKRFSPVLFPPRPNSQSPYGDPQLSASREDKGCERASQSLKHRGLHCCIIIDSLSFQCS